MSSQLIDGIGTVKFTRFPTNQAIVDAYAAQIKVIQTILYMNPKDVTEETAAALIKAINALKTLAKKGLNIGGQQFYVTTDMATQIDLLNKSLAMVGITSSASATLVNRWKDMGIDGIDTLLKQSQDAVDTNRSLQALIELEYIRTANDVLTDQLSSLEQAISATKGTIEELTKLQNIRNLIGPDQADLIKRVASVNALTESPIDRAKRYAEALFKYMPASLKNYYSWMGFVISKPEDLLIGSQVPIPDPENPNLTMVGFPSKIKLTDAPPYNGAVITVVSGGSGAIGSWMDEAVVKIPAGTFGTKVDGTPVPPNDIDEHPLRDVDEIINQQDNPTFLGGTFTNLKDAVKAYGVNAPWLPASQRGDYASTVTPDEGNDDLFALFADWGPSNDESHVFNNPSQYFYKEDNSKFNFYPDNLKILALNQLGYTQEQINEIIGTTEPGSDNGFWKVVAVPTDGKTFPTILPGDANKSIPDILDDAFKNPVTVSVILGNRSPQDVLRDVQAARLELAKQLSILDKLNPPQIDPTTKLPQRDPNSLAGKIATVLDDLNNLMGGVDANLYPYKFERDASGNIIYDANGQPVLQYQKNTDGSFKLDANGQKIPVLSDAFEGLKKWLIDNRNAAFGDTGADQSGKFQENVTNALTAASNLNDTQKETFRRYMFVFEEYYKSASAILNAINQLLNKMAQNISR